ncbi:MAG TPA: ATP-grasp domain-containing protein [Candidatus Lokiarchaeia archaeon]|nr:ATP-grasp domain-containing protein [Candidatus Lokiarchaeia archaeon]
MVKKILITGAGGPAGVNVLRSLRDCGEKMEVYGTDISSWHAVYAEPWCDKVFLVPRCTDTVNYIAAVNDIIDNYGVEFIHPQPDIEVKIISENREEFHAKTYLPTKETIRICQDKQSTAEIWEREGFPTAKAILLHHDSLEEDVARAFEELGAKIWVRATHGAGGTGSTPAESVDTVLNWIRYWQSRGNDWEFIAQEFLPGRNIAVTMIFKDGDVVVSQGRERLEYIYPYLAPSGVTGTPVVARTVNEDRINELATQAVVTVDPHATGVFSVDMKEDKDGTPIPTEINAGRFFTTSYYTTAGALRFGVWYANFPYVLLKLAYDEDLGDVQKYNILPEYYWIRHIDCGEHIRTEDELPK